MDFVLRDKYTYQKGANFRGRDLRGANLTSANLFRADFCDCDLAWAIFDGANLGETTFDGSLLALLLMSLILTMKSILGIIA